MALLQLIIALVGIYLFCFLIVFVIIPLVYKELARKRLGAFNLEKYLEKSEDLADLYRYAKSKEILFEIRPSSYSCFGDRAWSTTVGGKIIFIQIDARTLKPLPIISGKEGLRFTLSHEIGHSLQDRELFECSVLQRNIERNRPRNCLFEELTADQIGLKILYELGGFKNSNEAEYWRSKKTILRYQCKNCIRVLAQNRCPKSKELEELKDVSPAIKGLF